MLMSGQHVADAAELELVEQALQPGFRLVQVMVVAHARQRADVDSRLSGIDFPWVNVEDARPLFHFVQAPESVTRPAIW